MRKDYNLEKRKFVIGGFIVVVVAIYLWKLFDIQIVNDKYQDLAVSNARYTKITIPARGQIFDRNGKQVVYNELAYDLVFVPKDVQEFDTATMCVALRTKPEAFDSLWKKKNNLESNSFYNSTTPQILVKDLDSIQIGRLNEILSHYSGFEIRERIIRRYKYVAAANILGDIREVNAEDIERDSDNYYIPGDYTGDLGIEKSYESYLRGVKGKVILKRDATGRIIGPYNDKKDDVAPIPGKDLYMSIDIDLQRYGESLMRGRRGAIVAIEPKTGEVLALVTSPTYDPSLLVGKERGKNYSDLLLRADKPLFDRAIMAAYPPGSTFKPTQGLIFRQEGIIDNSTSYPCYRGYINKGLKIACHGHGSPIALQPAIATSCNGFFCWGLYYMLNNKKYGGLEKSFTLWKDYIVSMGYGYKLNIDLPGESRGFIPNYQFYNKMIGKDKWGANSIISIAIGQGEIMATPLQIANLSATIANRGYYITPHVVKKITDVGTPKEFTEQHHTKINSVYYNDIVAGMRMAVVGGTCRGANLPGLDVCGKTGTVQNPHGRDHSVFMGFAPKDDPKIAICVYVENAGFGAQVAVPLGARIFERYLLGKTEDTEQEQPGQQQPGQEPVKNDSSTITQGATALESQPCDDSPWAPIKLPQEYAILSTTTSFLSRNGLYKG
ncbi:MAG: penicillin-binding protein 2 [Muribaculaceae bacterium]|nr:penicillin-binding protein 2 [Muribaculaceae bacterium]